MLVCAIGLQLLHSKTWPRLNSVRIQTPRDLLNAFPALDFPFSLDRLGETLSKSEKCTYERMSARNPTEYHLLNSDLAPRKPSRWYDCWKRAQFRRGISATCLHVVSSHKGRCWSGRSLMYHKVHPIQIPY